MLTQICHAKYCLFLSCVKNTSSNSVTGKALNEVIASSTRCFRHSLLKKIIEHEEKSNAEISHNVKALRLLSKPGNICARIFTYCSSGSVIMESIKTIKNELLSSPFATAGIIIFTAAITNIILSVALHREISMLGWPVRLLFLCAGCAGMLHKNILKRIKKSDSMYHPAHKKHPTITNIYKKGRNR